MFFLIHEDEQTPISNAKGECLLCLGTLFNAPSKTTSSRFCSTIKKQVRLGCKDGEISVALCVNNEPKSSRLFYDKLNALKEAYSGLRFAIKERCVQHKSAIEGHFNALSHNVVTYNGKSITAAYLLVPQDKLVSASDKKEFVKNCINKEPDTAADSLLTMLKGLELTKNEFSVYNKLHCGTDQGSISRQRHKIHKLMQMAINVFWRDFQDKKIKIDNGSCDFFVSVEFESFMPALIHLMDNMSKYTIPNHEVSITYKKVDKTLLIKLAMLSFFVFPDEKERIWDVGYSGKLAKQTQKDGNGLGMHAMKKLIELNMGKFIFKPDVRLENAIGFEGVMYANNEIAIEIPIAKR